MAVNKKKKANEMDELTKAIKEIQITPDVRRSKRLRHKKAANMAKQKNENKDSNKTKKKITKSKTKPSAKQIDEKEESDIIKPNPNKNDVIFPLFTSVKYKPITDIFEIVLPQHTKDWLCILLSMIIKSDLKKEVNAYAWMVLIFPSLLLIKHSKSSTINKKLKALATKTINTLQTFMSKQAKLCDFELNDALICAELYADECDKIPKCIWKRINTLMESTNTFNKFLKLTCARAKDIKNVQELLKCSAKELTAKKTVYSKTREKWCAFIGVYTQIVRLHRLSLLNGDKLSKKCKLNIGKMCNEFDEKYRMVLRDLLYPLKRRSDLLKMDYAYWRYKTMAMCTHSATTIPATFAGYFGFIEMDKNNEIDVCLWNVMMDALKDDIDRFGQSLDKILNGKEKDLLEGIDKMPKRDTADLRILDNVCYNSLCCLIMQESIGKKKKNDKLVKMRQDVRICIEQLSEKKLLFCEKMDGLDGDLLQSCFLTYDKEQKDVWSVHLMSGILLNYWQKKE